MTKISVVIPTYRRPDLLDRLLGSIEAQTCLPGEVIVVDDCSGMSELYQEVIDKYSQKLNLQFLQQKTNQGAPAARNRGIRTATNEWIALVDDDDEWLPEKLEKQQQVIDSANEKVGIIYTWTKAVGKKGQESYDSCHSHAGDIRANLLTTNFIMSASIMVKKNAIIKAGLFDEGLPSCQDWDTWINISLEGYHAEVVPEVLTIYHRHGGESIGLSSNAQRGYKLLLQKHWLDILKHTSPVNWLKKAWLFVKVSRS